MKVFYNPKVSALKLELAESCGFIALAKTTLKPHEKYVRGEKCFDWQNAVKFKISDEEADLILENLRGKKFKMTLEHYPTDGKSYCNIEYDPKTRLMIVAVTVVKGDDKRSVSYRTTTIAQTKQIIKWLQLVSYSTFMFDLMYIFERRLVDAIMTEIKAMRRR